MFSRLLLLLLMTWKFASMGEDLSSEEEVDELENWTDDRKDNIWEHSGFFEGDIIITPWQRNGRIGEELRWDNREIPYEFDPVFNEQHRGWIRHALKQFPEKTCVKTRPRNATDKDYVYITGESRGCFSSVGRTGGKQILNLRPDEIGRGCMKEGTIVHEFLHAFGFYHQQSSLDRDNYVDIIWENIKCGKYKNFNKYTSDEVSHFGEKYDYESVMHYSSYAFSWNGNKTIVSKDPLAQIGQRIGLSRIDILKLDRMYKCIP